MWDVLEGRMDESERPRTFHNIECARLRGGKCNCGMAVTLVPPTHYTPLDGIQYSYDEGSSRVLEYRVNGEFIQVFDGDDLVDEFLSEQEGVRDRSRALNVGLRSVSDD
jgi:hypothetical protein